jgi:succinate dehydrogenase (ubiquinone) cytochrome b560 subunit
MVYSIPHIKLTYILVLRPTFTRSTPAILNNYRPLTTESIPASEAGSIIAAQRKHRPTSPHLLIYKPQVSWYLSALNRITGCIISGGTRFNHVTKSIGVYVFGAAYLVSPIFGWHLDVPTMAAAFGSLPVVAKVGIKSLIAFPFAFHSINGLRHLSWDTGIRTFLFKMLLI